MFKVENRVKMRPDWKYWSVLVSMCIVQIQLRGRRQGSCRIGWLLFADPLLAVSEPAVVGKGNGTRQPLMLVLTCPPSLVVWQIPPPSEGLCSPLPLSLLWVAFGVRVQYAAIRRSIHFNAAICQPSMRGAGHRAEACEG